MSKFYTFKYEEHEPDTLGKYPSFSVLEKKIEFDDDSDSGSYWPNVLREFVDFLSSIYGYSIRERIHLDVILENEDFDMTREIKEELAEKQHSKQTDMFDDYINSINKQVQE